MKEKPNQSLQPNGADSPFCFSKGLVDAPWLIWDVGQRKKLHAMSGRRRSHSLSLPAFCVRIVSFLCAVVGAIFALFVNPINWRLYADFTMSDWIWLWISNIAIVALIGVAWWFGHRRLVHLIDGKTEPNQSSQRNAMAKPISGFEDRSSRG